MSHHPQNLRTREVAAGSSEKIAAGPSPGQLCLTLAVLVQVFTYNGNWWETVPGKKRRDIGASGILWEGLWCQLKREELSSSCIVEIRGCLDSSGLWRL